MYGSPAELRLQHDGNGSYSRLISDSNNQLNIYTGGGPHLAMTIDGSQNVGIDLASPDTTYKLDVGGAGQFTTSTTNQQNDFNTGQLTVRNSQNAQGAFIDFRAKSNTGVQGVIAKIGGFNTYSGSGYDGLLTFSTRQNSDNSMVERLRINKDGNIGIGEDNPQTVLHINNNVPMIRLTDANASGTPDCEIGGAGGNIDISADINGEKSDSVIRFNVDGGEKASIT